jgi:hypothetical protein
METANLSLSTTEPTEEELLDIEELAEVEPEVFTDAAEAEEETRDAEDHVSAHEAVAIQHGWTTISGHPIHNPYAS